MAELRKFWLLVVLLIHLLHAGELTDENYVPVEPIPETGLYTGIYYEVGMERFPMGRVTWTEKTHEHEGWHYVQIDARAEYRQNYQKTGVWYNDTQWFFTEAENEPGWFTLRNRQHPERLASVSRSDKVGNGHHIVLSGKGDMDQIDTLWKPVLHENGVYQLVIKSELDAPVTWTERQVTPNVTDAYFIQVDVNADPEHRRKYQKNGEWFLDTLFRFQEIDSELVAEMTHLERKYFPQIEEIWPFTRIDCQMVDSLIFTNVENKSVVKEISQKIVNRGQLKLKLERIPEIKMVESSGPISPAWLADSVEFQLAAQEMRSMQAITLETKEVSRFVASVAVPAYNTTKVKICKEYFDTEGTDVSIGARVYLAISEMSDRPLNENGKFKVVYGKLPAEMITVKRIQELVVGNLELGLGTEGNVDSKEEDHNVQILAWRKDKVMIRLRGEIKGRFGFRGVIASY